MRKLYMLFNMLVPVPVQFADCYLILRRSHAAGLLSPLAHVPLLVCFYV